jgi:hypothetical protein
VIRHLTMRDFPAGLAFLLIALFAAAVYFAIQFVFLLEAHEYFRRKLGVPLPLEDRAPGWVLCLLPMVIALTSILLLLLRKRRGANIATGLLWIGFVMLPMSNLAWQMLTDPFWNLLGPWLHVQRIIVGIALAGFATVYMQRSRGFAWFLSRDQMNRVFD